MPVIVPSDWRALEAIGPSVRELETLSLFDRSLPAHLTVFHGIHWTRLDRGTAVIGEIDFAVLAPSGRVLLIEQKSGFLAETDDGLVKRYAQGEKSVPQQIKRKLDALVRRLSPLADGEPLRLDFLLYCPDYTVKRLGTAGLPPERIVDATRRDALCRVVTEALPADEPERPRLFKRLRQFFSDELQLTPDVSALVGRSGELVTRLSGGLASWARRLEFAPFRLRVIGTAGSGKTQLALAVLNDAAAAGRRALYVCFNRPLADHLTQLAPPGSEVATFHQLCDRRLRAAGVQLDYRAANAFEATEREFARLPASEDTQVDELVIDEGQDMQADWVPALLGQLRAGGRAWWLEDPMQNLYGRPPVELPGWVTLHADTNYRTPRDVQEYINALVAPERRIVAASPFASPGVDVLEYGDDTSLTDATKRAITLALQGGFRKQDIAVVTYTGRTHSRLLPFDRLGPHALKRFSGRYDMFGNPEYEEGEILIETVYRFKGQAAPCVVFTEIDFDAVDALVRRKLFVGMTRASMRLILVMSGRAKALIGAGQ